MHLDLHLEAKSFCLDMIQRSTWIFYCSLKKRFYYMKYHLQCTHGLMIIWILMPYRIKFCSIHTCWTCKYLYSILQVVTHKCEYDCVYFTNIEKVSLYSISQIGAQYRWRDVLIIKKQEKYFQQNTSTCDVQSSLKSQC